MTDSIDLVIFDCDGVLIDSERLAVQVDAVVLAALGWELTTDEIVRRFVGRSHAAMVAEIETHLGRPLPDGWEAEFQPLYDHAFATELTPVPGVVAALDAIGLCRPTCVASSSSHERLRTTLGLTGLHPRFAGRIFSAEEVANGKPAPDLFLHAASVLGVAPGRCVVVEDSRFGVEAARAAGMRSFGYAGGLTPSEWLEGPGTVVFSDMAELPGLLADAGKRAFPAVWPGVAGPGPRTTPRPA
ncbi:HAD family hydrolase [Kitasatospora sp. NPDC085879]|uniref:HAD family hydrolase n=1 Tax=Kitasatospora sp. NPDC085879 TaxID=3154769 RepID=UPI0034133CA8